MGNVYIESEKLWRGPSLEFKLPKIGLGQAILENLNKIHPKRVLEVEHESGTSFTAEEIRYQTITVAQNLIRLGVKKGDIAIIFSKSNIKMTPITFALYTIGAPINFFYLDLKGDEIKYYFEKLDPTVILYEEEFKNDVFEALENLNLSKLQHVLSLDSKTQSVDEILFKPSDDIECFQPPDIGDPNELPAVLPFTSGSTGMPKIAQQSHAMLLLGLYNKWCHMEPKSIVCVLSDLRWICQAELMMHPIFFDVKRIYTSKCEKDFDDAYEYELLHKNKVSHFFTVPILLFQTITNAVKSNNVAKLRYLQTILLCGEVTTDSLIEYAAKIIPNCKIISSYGMTELHGKVASDEDVVGKVVNGGILGNEYFAKIKCEKGKSLGPNEKGLLYLKSNIPILGYFKNDQGNLRADGWFTTGDYAYMDSDHLLNIIIRYNYLLRFNGEFVIPTDIENIINTHPNVLISSLVGYPDPKSSESEIGTIFVMIQDVAPNDIQDELIVSMKQNLLKHQAKLVRFLKIVDKMPLCNNCKINRNALKEMAVKDSHTYLRLWE